MTPPNPLTREELPKLPQGFSWAELNGAWIAVLDGCIWDDEEIRKALKDWQWAL